MLQNSKVYYFCDSSKGPRVPAFWQLSCEQFNTWYNYNVFFFIAGKPVPSVSWYMENTLLQSHSVSSPDNVVISKIDVSSITRSYLNRTYTCQATNTNLIQPFHRTVRLELHRKFSPLNLSYKFLHSRRRYRKNFISEF